jgi:hypothetical protein
VKHLNLVMIVLLILYGIGCDRPRAKSDKSFDEIRGMVNEKTAAEVERLLGEPDSREAMMMSGERWIWWNYTYLDGNNYPPEDRGRVVHLEIVFEPDGPGTKASNHRAELRVGGLLGVSYTLPQKAM